MTHWREQARCRGLSVLFDGKEYRNEAVHICRRHCPVLAECAAWAARADLIEVTAGGEYWTCDRVVSTQTSDVLTVFHHAYCRAFRHDEEDEAS